MIETTIVGWDDTSAAQRALDWALTRLGTTKLVLVRVADSTVETFAANSPTAAARIALMDEAERVRDAHPDLAVTSELVAGDPVDELARFSNEKTLVVVGTDRQSGGGIRYGWSVGARLAASAHGPVAIVPVGHDVRRRSIVVGVDGSPASNTAVEFAAAEADRTGAPLHLVHAWQELPIWMDDQVPDAEYLRSLEEMHSHILDDSLQDLEKRHPGVHADRTLVRGPAYRAVLEAAQDAALIVVGNHGLRGLKRVLLGSVSHSIILDALCPVVVVRSE
ncbi:MAG TPA: universal stress protein [Microbacteriaceae bacterium]